MSHQTLARVIKSIAATTRYPTELLTPGADLENDLGIDSVKRLEVVMGLGDEFNLRLELEERNPSIRTIQDVTKWIDGLLSRNGQDQRHTNDREYGLPNDLADAPIRVLHEAEPRRPAAPHVARIPDPQPTIQPTPQPSPSTKPLAGKVALVTGSGRGVGRTIASVLALRGATVIVNSFHSREQGEQTTSEIIQRGGSAIHLWGSVANPRHVDQMMAHVEQAFGRLDILVCNASDGRIGPFMDLTLDDWDRAFRTNVAGHHQCVVRATPIMRSGGGGSIITMSAVGSKGYIEGLGSQGVVKAAVETLTRYLACELGQFRIRVNCVVGGPVYGDLLSKFPKSQSTQDHWESITPDGELCSPMDLANAIAFLVSDEARGINGAVWAVDHGFSAISDGRPMRHAVRELIGS